MGQGDHPDRRVAGLAASVSGHPRAHALQATAAQLDGRAQSPGQLVLKVHDVAQDGPSVIDRLPCW